MEHFDFAQRDARGPLAVRRRRARVPGARRGAGAPAPRRPLPADRRARPGAARVERVARAALVPVARAPTQSSTTRACARWRARPSAAPRGRAQLIRSVPAKAGTSGRHTKRMRGSVDVAQRDERGDRIGEARAVGQAERRRVEVLEARLAALGARDRGLGVDLHQAQALRRLGRVHAREELQVARGERQRRLRARRRARAPVDLDPALDPVVEALEPHRAPAARRSRSARSARRARARPRRSSRPGAGAGARRCGRRAAAARDRSGRAARRPRARARAPRAPAASACSPGGNSASGAAPASS